ncbi:MAG TPA: hypothetical protein VK988_02955 [Acidimicrobiales bacterium]|nr:hypothetical protein [Acidimicrobiales bacterium]
MAILIETTAETLPPDRFYEDICIELIRTNLESLSSPPLCCLTFLVARPDLLADVASFAMLRERVANRGCALCSLRLTPIPGESPDRPHAVGLEHQVVIAGASHQPGVATTVVPSVPGEPAPSVEVPSLAAALTSAVAKQLPLEFDHFEIDSSRLGEPGVHFPCVLNARTLANNDELVGQLRQLSQEATGSAAPVLCAVEIEGSGVADGLLPRLAAGEPDQLDDGTRNLRGRDVVVVMDFSARFHRPDEVAAKLTRRGASKVRFLALVRTDDAVATASETVALLSLPVRSASPDGHDCDLCAVGAPIHRGSHRSQLIESLVDYHGGVFWRMLNLSPTFSRLGHWSSPRTENHFWLRIMMADLLTPFADAFAHRLLRALETTGLLSVAWVDYIVVPDDDESAVLGSALTRLLPGSHAELVAVPRSVMRQVSAGELGAEAKAWVAESTERSGSRGNAIIVDQAAHHFRTYSAIKTLIDAIGWHSLAFGVVVDRTGVNPDHLHLLHDARYASLYRWPFPPRTRLDCSCSE